MNTKNILTEVNLQDTHWGKRIIEAEERGGFSDKDVEIVKSWDMLVCENDSQRHEVGFIEPLNTELWEYGDQFAGSIVNGDFIQAALALVEIEKREAILAAENAI